MRQPDNQRIFLSIERGSADRHKKRHREPVSAHSTIETDGNVQHLPHQLAAERVGRASSSNSRAPGSPFASCESRWAGQSREFATENATSPALVARALAVVVVGLLALATPARAQAALDFKVDSTIVARTVTICISSVTRAGPPLTCVPRVASSRAAEINVAVPIGTYIVTFFDARGLVVATRRFRLSVPIKPRAGA